MASSTFSSSCGEGARVVDQDGRLNPGQALVGRKELGELVTQVAELDGFFLVKHSGYFCRVESPPKRVSHFKIQIDSNQSMCLSQSITLSLSLGVLRQVPRSCCATMHLPQTTQL